MAAASLAVRAAFGGLAACVSIPLLQRRRGCPRVLPCPLYCYEPLSMRLHTNAGAVPRSARKLRMRREDLIFKNNAALHAEYAIEAHIWTGSEGEVLQASHRRLGVKRAVKKIPMSNAIAHDVGEEVRALIGLDHPHIVKAIEYFEDDTYFYLVQEFCTGPDLFDYALAQVKASGSVSEQAASIILRQCLKAVICCHSNGYIHRDIKPENFMVTGTDNTVKMIDFGLATRFLSTEQLTRVTGTGDYMAPEMLQNKYNNAADLWSLGVLLFALLSVEHLLPEDATQKRTALEDPGFVAKRIATSQTLRKRELTVEARDLLERLLKHEPIHRITASEALLHPFVQKHWGKSLGHDALPWRGEFDSNVVHKLRDFAEAPRVKKAALLAVAHLATAHAQTQELIEVEHTFRFIDQDGDGRITCVQLADGLTSNGIDVPPDLEEVFAICDGSSSGALTYVEFVACCFPLGSLDERICTEAFRLLSQESNGRIGPRDLQHLCQSYRYLSMEYMQMIREVDISGKGYISLADFHCMLRGEAATVSQTWGGVAQTWTAELLEVAGGRGWWS